MGAREIFLHRIGPHDAVVEQRVERRGRNGVDRMPADEILHVHEIRVGGVLRAGAGPERTLDVRAFFCERFETLVFEDLLEARVDQLEIGDAGLSKQIALLRLAFVDPFLEQLVDGGIDAAHEDARNRRHAVER